MLGHHPLNHVHSWFIAMQSFCWTTVRKFLSCVFSLFSWQADSTFFIEDVQGVNGSCGWVRRGGASAKVRSVREFPSYNWQAQADFCYEGRLFYRCRERRVQSAHGWVVLQPAQVGSHPCECWTRLHCVPTIPTCGETRGAQTQHLLYPRATASQRLDGECFD